MGKCLEQIGGQIGRNQFQQQDIEGDNQGGHLSNIWHLCINRKKKGMERPQKAHMKPILAKNQVAPTRTGSRSEKALSGACPQFWFLHQSFLICECHLLTEEQKCPVHVAVAKCSTRSSSRRSGSKKQKLSLKSKQDGGREGNDSDCIP